MKIIYKDPKELKDYKNNAKQHPKSQLQKIVKSIDMAGFYSPIVIDSNNVIIAGHGRKIAAIDSGLSEVPCVVLDIDKATADKIRLLDNKSSESGYDVEKLLSELQRFDLEELIETGYNQNDYDILIKSITPMSETPSAYNTQKKESTSDDTVTQDPDKEISTNEFSFKHKCPKCGYHFNED